MEEKKTEEKKIVCNCKDEFKITPCPEHHAGLSTNRTMVLTDEDMAPEKIRRQEGYGFKCRNTKCDTYKNPESYSILVHHKHCPECGMPFKIQSKIVTTEINRLQVSGKI